MSISVESAEQAEALVNTLQIEGASLTDANLTGLSSSDLEQLADLQAELECINASDIETGVEGIEVKQMLDDDIVETEIGEQEVEIEAEEELEEPASPDEILPDFKEQSESVIKYDGSSVAPPPLRPLTIAPKPVTPKVPMALKTAAVVNAGSGQQIVLIQSPGYNRSLALSPPLHPFPYCIPNGTKISGTTNTVNIGGQPIKLVSAQGQPVTIPNLQNVQLANKSGGMVQLRAVSKSSIINQTTDTATVGQAQIKNISGAIKKIVPQNKNIVAKVIVGGQQGQVVLTSQGNETVQPQQIKLVSSMASGTIPASAKTITLAQAQQMGLITSGKVQQLIPQSPSKQTMVVNKPIQAKTIKVLPQVKSPTKILPAPIQGQKLQTKQGLQRVIIKQGGQLKAGTMVAGGMNQVIRIPASQGISAGQIHQINVPGKGVQYIRFMTAASTAPSTTTTNTSSAVKAQTQTTSVQKAQVVPVAGITVNRTTVVNKSSGSTPTQNIIKVVPMNSTQARPVAPKPVTGQRLLIPATNSQTKSNQATIATIPASALSQIQGAILPSGNNVSQIVMLPAQYVQQIQNQSQTSTASVPTPKVAVTAKSVPQKTCLKISPTQIKEEIVPPAQESVSSPESTNYLRTLEPNGIRPRKPCNCTKSLCLKLYCDCFANGEFCHLCNCMNCFNNLEKEEERQRAIRNCLERNPNAFRPKIGKGKDAGESSVRKHTKGCNCKRSGCLKNYCECYEAKIACSSNCKCIGCRNIEDSMEKKNVRLATPLPEAAQLQVVPTAKSKLVTPAPDVTNFRPMITNTSTKLPSTYMTNEVIEATNQCMIAQADEAERNMLSEELAKRQILEEFGRCLVQIIECSSNASGSNT